MPLLIGVNMPANIFINYRRENASADAGRLHDRFVQSFERKHVFMDVDHIPAGADFVKYLSEQVANCKVMLVVIKEGWLDVRDPWLCASVRSQCHAIDSPARSVSGG